MNITIEDQVVRRGKKQMPVDKFCQVIREHTVSGMSETPIPDNVRWIVEKGERAVYVVELQSELRRISWNEGVAQRVYNEHGDRIVYQESGEKYTVATPYVVLVIPFLRNRINGSEDRPVRVFYRTSPLKSIDDPVFNSNLNNVLPVDCIYEKSQGGCMCLDRLDVNGKMSREEVVNAVVNHLWASEFNHEYGHNFIYTARETQDRRIASITNWQAESLKNPDFVLDVKWPETGLTIRSLINQNINARHPNLGNLLLKIA